MSSFRASFSGETLPIQQDNGEYPEVVDMECSDEEPISLLEQSQHEIDFSIPQGFTLNPSGCFPDYNVVSFANPMEQSQDIVASDDDLVFIQEVISQAQADLTQKLILPQAILGLASAPLSELSQNLSIFSTEIQQIFQEYQRIIEFSQFLLDQIKKSQQAQEDKQLELDQCLQQVSDLQERENCILDDWKKEQQCVRNLEAELKKLQDQQVKHVQDSHRKQQIIDQLYREQERLERVIEKNQKHSLLLDQKLSESIISQKEFVNVDIKPIREQDLEQELMLKQDEIDELILLVENQKLKFKEISNVNVEIGLDFEAAQGLMQEQDLRIQQLECENQELNKEVTRLKNFVGGDSKMQQQLLINGLSVDERQSMLLNHSQLQILADQQRKSPTMTFQEDYEVQHEEHFSRSRQNSINHFEHLDGYYHEDHQQFHQSESEEHHIDLQTVDSVAICIDEVDHDSPPSPFNKTPVIKFTKDDSLKDFVPLSIPNSPKTNVAKPKPQLISDENQMKKSQVLQSRFKERQVQLKLMLEDNDPMEIDQLRSTFTIQNSKPFQTDHKKVPVSPMVRNKNFFVFTDEKDLDQPKVENNQDLVIELVDLDHYNPNRKTDIDANKFTKLDLIKTPQSMSKKLTDDQRTKSMKPEKNTLRHSQLLREGENKPIAIVKPPQPIQLKEQKGLIETLKKSVPLVEKVNSDSEDSLNKSSRIRMLQDRKTPEEEFFQMSLVSQIMLHPNKNLIISMVTDFQQVYLSCRKTKKPFIDWNNWIRCYLQSEVQRIKEQMSQKLKLIKNK